MAIEQRTTTTPTFSEAYGTLIDRMTSALEGIDLDGQHDDVEILSRLASGLDIDAAELKAFSEFAAGHITRTIATVSELTNSPSPVEILQFMITQIAVAGVIVGRGGAWEQ